VDGGLGGWVEWVCVDLDAGLWVGAGVGNGGVGAVEGGERVDGRGGKEEQERGCVYYNVKALGWRWVGVLIHYHKVIHVGTRIQFSCPCLDLTFPGIYFSSHNILRLVF
jgi:hypothetical protein